MSCFALYLKNENIELYPTIEEHNLTEKDVESYLENVPEIEKWILYDHLPTDKDIESFENFIDGDSDDE